MMEQMMETKAREALIPMQEVTQADYFDFIKRNKKIIIEDTELEIGKHWEITELQPKDFKLETDTIWSFPDRGKWATHYLNAKYRGNWAPQVARNLILRYSKEGETILDSFIGSGTTLIECKLTKRNGVGIDINKEAVLLTRDRLNFNSLNPELSKTAQKTYVGDARNLDKIKNESIDFIATHPPYAGIISYTKNSNHKQNGDLSKIHSIEEFERKMGEVAGEFFRVLKSGKYCAILIGDTRRAKHQVPISQRVLNVFLSAGFILKENIIKAQHNTKTAPLWKNMSVKYNFLLLAHENLFVFRKPEKDEKTSRFKDSMTW